MLALREVSAGYGPLTILERLSLTLGSGEILLILGANGSGKSTVLKTIMGLTRFTAGSVCLGSAEIGTWAPHRRAAAGLGYVPQTGNVFSGLTVLENLRMGFYLRQGPISDALEGTFHLFPQLKDRLHAKAGSLSGGERRMLSIALTMVAQPKILLLDEPSSDLAPAAIELVFAAIERIHEESAVPVLIVEQNVARGLAITDRVIVMVRGRVAADLPADRIRDADLHNLFMRGLAHSTSPAT